MPQGASPALEEVIIDKNKPVLLRLSDRSMRVLPYSVNLVEALSLLEVSLLQTRAAAFTQTTHTQTSLSVCLFVSLCLSLYLSLSLFLSLMSFTSFLAHPLLHGTDI